LIVLSRGLNRQVEQSAAFDNLASCLRFTTLICRGDQEARTQVIVNRGGSYGHGIRYRQRPSTPGQQVAGRRSLWPQPADIVANLEEHPEMMTKLAEEIDILGVIGGQSCTSAAGHGEHGPRFGLSRFPTLLKGWLDERQISVLTSASLQHTTVEITSYSACGLTADSRLFQHIQDYVRARYQPSSNVDRRARVPGGPHLLNHDLIGDVIE
jgi:hypothetical protein